MARAGTPLVPALLAACALGCSAEDGARRPAWRNDLLALDLAVPRAEDLGPRLVRRLTVPPDVEPWELRPVDRRRIARIREGEYSLQVLGSGVTGVIVPGPFEPVTFNQVVLRGVFPGRFQVHLLFRDHVEGREEPEVVARGNYASVEGALGEERAVLFEFPRFRRRGRPVDELALIVQGKARGFELRSIDLLSKPLAAALPLPEEGPALIDIRFEGRSGVGLSTTAPLVGTFDVERGDELTFSCGQPFQVRRPNELPRVRVTLTSGKRERVREVELEQRLTVEERWHEARVPLDEFAGRRVDARFELVVQSGHEALCALAEVRVRRPAAEPGTVLLVSSDTHRGDHLGSAGLGVDVRTPVVDELAARGVLFEDCYSVTNVTCPSHVSMMTGIHLRDTRVTSNMSRLGDEARTLAEVYRANGYTTLAVVSVRHLSHLGVGVSQGFDRVLCPPEATWDAEDAVTELERWLPANEGVPLFVWLHLFDAHYPYEPPGEFDRAYYPDGRDPYDPGLPPIEGITAGGTREELAPLRDLEFPVAQYRGEVTYLDDQLRRVFDHPRFRDGVLAFTSDHGELFAKNGVFFDHTGLYPENLHVPLVLAWPGGPRGVRVGRPVSQLGLARTLLDLSGLDHVDFPGDSLVADLEGGAEEPRFAISAHGNAALVEFQGWVYVLHLRDHEGPNAESREEHEDDLFELAADPECLVDRAEAERDRAARLRALLLRWLALEDDAGLVRRAQHSESALRQLAKLGYATSTPTSTAGAWYDEECGCVHCARYLE